MATPNQPANEQPNDTQPMVSQQLEKIDVTIGGETKSLTPEELEHLQAQLNSNLKRSKPPSSIAKEEQDIAPDEPPRTKSYSLHQAYKKARKLDSQGQIVDPAESSPNMPVDTQGVGQADTLEALNEALKQYHET